MRCARFNKMLNTKGQMPQRKEIDVILVAASPVCTRALINEIPTLQREMLGQEPTRTVELKPHRSHRMKEYSAARGYEAQ
eukprot:6212493-Pleurochrysis_carterae.AAC.1